MLLSVLALTLVKSSPSWADLRNAYAYRPLTEAPKFESANLPNSARGNWFKFEYPSPSGDTVHAIFAEPKQGSHFPVVILLHGLGGNKEGIAFRFAPKLLADGFAIAAIDAPSHGQRETDADKAFFQSIFQAAMSSQGDLSLSIARIDPDHKIALFISHAMSGGVVDNRILLDALSKRPELDMSHVDLVGESMGSIMGTILAGVDHRLKDLALLVGGDPVLPEVSFVPEQLQGQAYDTSCSLYAPHCSGPEFMLSGSKDTIIPRAATERLYHAFKIGSCKLSWYDSNHFLPAKADDDAVGWLDAKGK